MIKNNIVFVIGAGASVPYMFPSGPKLIEEYKKNPPDVITNATDGVVHPRDAQDLWQALHTSASGSIDALLERRTDLEAAGKALIASHLLKNERHSKQHTFWKPDWIQYLIGIMSEGARNSQEFAKETTSPSLLITMTASLNT